MIGYFASPSFLDIFTYRLLKAVFHTHPYGRTIFSIAMGVFAGKGRKALWSLPILTPVLFVLGTWAFFGMGEPAFLLYAGIYLILGMISMGITHLLIKLGKK